MNFDPKEFSTVAQRRTLMNNVRKLARYCLPEMWDYDEIYPLVKEKIDRANKRQAFDLIRYGVASPSDPKKAKKVFESI